MDKNLVRGVLAPLIFVAMLSLTGCGGDSSDPATSTVGGTVSGLNADEDVTLLNNGGEAVVVAANGGFTFSPGQASGSTYDVTVKSHMPGISCSVSNGSGTVGASNVTGVAVSCAAGKETIVHSFPLDQTDGAFPNAVIMDAAGNLYGTTTNGGANGWGTVFEISSTGAETVLHSFASDNGTIPQPNGGLIIDSNGNLYGTIGASGPGAVFKIDPTTAEESTVHTFCSPPPSTDGCYPMAGLIIDSAGNLYGTTAAGGVHGEGTVFKINPTTDNETILYSFVYGSSDGAAPEGQLFIDSSGNLYGTTVGGGVYEQGTVFEISSTGTETILHSFAGGQDGYSSYAGMVMDGAGNLYGTTSYGGAYSDGTVFAISPTGVETVLHSFGGGDGDGKFPVAQLIMDAAGNLYGMANGGVDGFGTVFKINPTTGKETVLYSFAGADGAFPAGQLAIDSSGNLYGATASGGVYGYGTVFKID